jgi:hypothetical protein
MADTPAPAAAFDPDADLQQQSAQPEPDFDVDKDLHQHAAIHYKPYSATEGMSNFDLAMAGAGKSVVDLGRGVKQLFGFGDQAEIDEAAKRDRELMHTGAGLTGYLGGSLASMAIPGTLAAKGAGALGLTRTAAAASALTNPGTFGAAAASGALQGALQPTETGQSRVANTAIGGALGPLGNLLGRGGTAIAHALSEPIAASASRAVQALQDAGVPLDAAQRTGSVLWNRAKLMLSDNPLTTGAQAAFAGLQQKTYNRALLRTMGETADAATPEVMGRAMTRMGKAYDDIATRNSMKYDHIEGPLNDILNSSAMNLNDSQHAILQKNADDILKKAALNDGTLSGDQFANVKKNLDALSASGDSDVASAGRDMRQALNDALLKTAQETGNTADVEALKATNQQWRNMRNIEGAIDKTGEGDISPARLAGVMSQVKNRSNSIYGKGDTALADLAHAGNNLLPNKTPNSGTPTRLLQQAILPAIGAGYEKLKGGDWQDIAKGAAVGVAIPKAAQLMLNSQRGKVAIDALRALREPSNMSALSGAVLQHLPQSGLETAQQATERKQGSE